MTTGKQLAGLLLLTTALTVPGVALAQDDPAEAPASQPQDSDPEEGDEEPEVSIPGGSIIVTGRINRNPERNSTQVVNLLSTEQIARTGEGDIAGALSRVTGLSVQGDG